MKTAKTNLVLLSDPVKNERPLSLEALYSLFYSIHTPDFFFGGECHAPWEMVYVVEGNVGVSADDRVYTLSPGDIIFHQPMEFHRIWSERGSSPKTIIASFDISGTYAHRLRRGVFHLGKAADGILESLFETLKLSDYAPIPGLSVSLIDRGAILQTIFPLLEALLIKLVLSPSLCSIDAQTGEKERLYTAIVTLLEKNLTGKITVAQIASALSISPATAKSCFSEYAGCGIHKYFLKLKIRTAIDFLREGQTVSEVSEYLGFSNPNYFGIVFRRETGKTPGAFRGKGLRG